MARLIDHFVEEPRTCSYLHDRVATLEHKVMLQVTTEETEGMLIRGWRRFGPDYFRPACRDCRECIPVRIPTATFRLSKSQRRAKARCASLIRRISSPRVDQERLDLYHAWHDSRADKRAWGSGILDENTYRMQFAMPHPTAREIAYYLPDTGKLVAVALSDETPAAWSAIYFYYDPAWASHSIGTANVVTQIELAGARGIPHVYLGYYVAECGSLAYKGRFQPQERLVSFVAPNDAPVWTPHSPVAKLASGVEPPLPTASAQATPTQEDET